LLQKHCHQGKYEVIHEVSGFEGCVQP
jgi:hypothetical protein